MEIQEKERTTENLEENLSITIDRDFLIIVGVIHAGLAS
jgi:hypothetical protein